MIAIILSFPSRHPWEADGFAAAVVGAAPSSAPRRSTLVYISARDSLIKELGFSVEFIDRCTKHSTPFLSAKRLYLLAAAASHWCLKQFWSRIWILYMLHSKILWDHELIWHRFITKILRKSFATSKTLWPHCKRLWLRDANLPQKRSCLHFTKTGWFTKRNICTSLSRVFVLRRNVFFLSFSLCLCLSFLELARKGSYLSVVLWELTPKKELLPLLATVSTYRTHTHSTIGNRSQQMLH